MTLALAFVQFALETAYTIIVGQLFWGYLPDCIADIPLVAGARLLIKKAQHRCTMRRWGIYFLSLRTWAWRFEDFIPGTLNEFQTGIMYLLASR